MPVDIVKTIVKEEVQKSALELLADRLKNIAKRKNWNADPEFLVYEYTGGNIDDAYQGGYKDGEADIARDVLEVLEPVIKIIRNG